MLVMYRINRLQLWLFGQFSVTPWIALPNILGAAANGGEPSVTEKLFWRDPTSELAPIGRALLHDTGERRECLERLSRLKRAVFLPGGVQRAADALIEFLDGRRHDA